MPKIIERLCKEKISAMPVLVKQLTQKITKWDDVSLGESTIKESASEIISPARLME